MAPLHDQTNNESVIKQITTLIYDIKNERNQSCDEEITTINRKLTEILDILEALRGIGVFGLP